VERAKHGTRRTVLCRVVTFGARSPNSLQFLAARRRDRKLTRPARSAELRRGRPGSLYRTRL